MRFYAITSLNADEEVVVEGQPRFVLWDEHRDRMLGAGGAEELADQIAEAAYADAHAAAIAAMDHVAEKPADSRRARLVVRDDDGTFVGMLRGIDLDAYAGGDDTVLVPDDYWQEQA